MAITKLSVTFGACACLLIALAVPLVRRRVPPNRLYGFRTPSTLKDERLWYEVNAKIGVDLLVQGIGLLGITSAHAISALSEGALALLGTLWIVGGGVWSLIHGFAIIRRQSRHRA